MIILDYVLKKIQNEVCEKRFNILRKIYCIIGEKFDTIHSNVQ